MTVSSTVAVVGLGYVGLPLALLAARKGHTVYGIDTDEKKINFIRQRVSPFADEEVAKQLANTTMTATTDIEVVKKAGIVIICVPTPVDENYMPDLTPVESACRAIAPRLQAGKGQLVVLESTVNPGVCQESVLPLLEKESGLRCGVDFYLAHCPERINPGDPHWNVENINRVVGSYDETGLKKAVSFYESIITGTIKPMGSIEEAEAVKVVENSFRDINIAFVNELARSFCKLGIDVVRVIEGAACKPFAFMAHYPGCGVGGHCIPVDPYYLIEYAKRNGFNHDFLALARQINNSMPEFTVERLIEGLHEKGIKLEGTPVAVLGLSYKADIDDCRHSPSFEIIKYLESYKAKVVTFDPFCQNISSAKSLEEALEGVQAVVLATGHSQFKSLTPEHLASRGIQVVVDGRNCLPKEEYLQAGLVYKGIGR